MFPDQQLADRLLGRIVTLKSNPHYRMADVIYRRGLRYQDSTEQVLVRPEFDGTILKTYLLSTDNIETPNIPLLSNLVERAISTREYTNPQLGELVIHIRAGDVVEHGWFLQGNFVDQIRQFGDIYRCTFVICFAFQEFAEKGWWLFSEEKLGKNKVMVRSLFETVISCFPNLKLAIFSNADIDKDFVYMITAQHFIRDQGGFSELVSDVRTHRKLNKSRP